MAKNKNKTKEKLTDALATKTTAPTPPAAPKAAPVAPVKVDKVEAKTEAPKAAPKGEDVLDGNGRVMFRKRSGEGEGTKYAKFVEKPVKKASTRFTTLAQPGNPTTLKFPTDRWGVTKDVKRAMIDMASRIAGDQRKMDLAVETLEVLAKHLKDKFAKDTAVRADYLERMQAKAEAKQPKNEQEDSVEGA